SRSFTISNTLQTTAIAGSLVEPRELTRTGGSMRAADHKRPINTANSSTRITAKADATNRSLRCMGLLRIVVPLLLGRRSDFRPTSLVSGAPPLPHHCQRKRDRRVHWSSRVELSRCAADDTGGAGTLDKNARPWKKI